MGGMCCAFVDDDDDNAQSNGGYGSVHTSSQLHHNSAIAQLMRTAMMQEQQIASHLVTHPQYTQAQIRHQAYMQQQAYLAQSEDMLTANDAEEMIRKAKTECSTVSVREGALYIDYKFIGYMPPGVDIY